MVLQNVEDNVIVDVILILGVAFQCMKVYYFIYTIFLYALCVYYIVDYLHSKLFRFSHSLEFIRYERGRLKTLL